MTENITIKAIYKNQTNKDGQAYLDRSQRPFTMVKIITTDGRTIWGRAYQGSPVLSWNQGDSHEVEIEQSQNGFLNFRTPKAVKYGSGQQSSQDTFDLQQRVFNLEQAIRLMDKRVQALEDAQEPEQLPFDD